MLVTLLSWHNVLILVHLTQNTNLHIIPKIYLIQDNSTIIPNLLLLSLNNNMHLLHQIRGCLVKFMVKQTTKHLITSTAWIIHIRDIILLLNLLPWLLTPTLLMMISNGMQTMVPMLILQMSWKI